MKKLLFAAAAVWLLAACNKELGPEYETPPVFDEVTFTTATQPDKIPTCRTKTNFYQRYRLWN